MKKAPLKLKSFKALTFDCYGTLIDWETGIWDALQLLLMQNPAARLPRTRALSAFARHENQLQADHPAMLYPDILAAVHRSLASEFELETHPRLDRDFAGSLSQWPAFSDTAEALRRLKKRYRLIVLSNVDRAGFAASNRKLGVVFDAVYTAEDIGSYKPDPANFEYLLAAAKRDFGLGPGDILHTAQSLFHDHAPARALGLATAWIDRQRLSEGGGWGATAKLDDVPDTDFLFHSMAEMAAAVEAERGEAS